MITETPFSKKRMGFVVWGNLNFAWIIMIKIMAVASIIAGLASLAAGVFAKLIVYGQIARISPAGFGQGAVIFFLLSISLLLLDKKS